MFKAFSFDFALICPCFCSVGVLMALGLLPERPWVTPSLFESSAKVEAVGVASARRFWGKFSSNFSLLEFGSCFFVSTIFTSLNALVVKVSLSNHFGLSALVGISSILEITIPLLASVVDSSDVTGMSDCFSLSSAGSSLSESLGEWRSFDPFSLVGSWLPGISTSVLLGFSGVFKLFFWLFVSLWWSELVDLFLFFFFLFLSFDLTSTNLKQPNRNS